MPIVSARLNGAWSEQGYIEHTDNETTVAMQRTYTVFMKADTIAHGNNKFVQSNHGDLYSPLLAWKARNIILPPEIER